MKPTVSVILTTYNARERLKFALESYRYQTYPKDRFEVIIVDDASIDGTKEWFERQKYEFKANYMYNPVNRGRSGTRNVGLKAATGEVIILSDCDMIAESDFIERHANYHEGSNNLVICGSFWNPIYSYMYTDQEKQIHKKIKKLILDQPELMKRFSVARKKLRSKPYARLLSVKDVPNITKSKLLSPYLPIAEYYAPYVKEDGTIVDHFYFPWIFFVVMNVSVRKNHLKKIGYFDEGLIGYGGEDTDVGYRLWQKGLRFIVDATLRNYHQEHPRNLLKQEDERFYNRLYLAKKHPTIEMILHLYVPVGNDISKSNFLVDRDRLLSEGRISPQFAKQLDWLVWKSAHTCFPQFEDELQVQVAIDDIFWAEIDELKRMPDHTSFVAYIEDLFNYINR